VCKILCYRSLHRSRVGATAGSNLASWDAIIVCGDDDMLTRRLHAGSPAHEQSAAAIEKGKVHHHLAVAAAAAAVIVASRDWAPFTGLTGHTAQS
jgi:hypothetical protein